MRQIWCGGTPVMSRPSSSTWPAVGCRWPVIRLNSVDLPAPFGSDHRGDLALGHGEIDTSDTATKAGEGLA